MRRLIGQWVALDADEGVLRPCTCGATVAVIKPGLGPHRFKLYCPDCGRGGRWLGASTVEMLKVAPKGPRRGGGFFPECEPEPLTVRKLKPPRPEPAVNRSTRSHHDHPGRYGHDRNDRPEPASTPDQRKPPWQD